MLKKWREKKRQAKERKKQIREREKQAKKKKGKRNWGKIIFILLGLLPLLGASEGDFVLLTFTFFVFVWLFQSKLKSLVKKINLSLFFKFLVLGIITGFIVEFFVFQNQLGLFSGDFWFNLILSMGVYDSLIIVWYFLLKKYKFSLKGVFLSAGIWGVVVEQDFAVLLSFNPFMYLYIFAVYGSFVSIPFVLMRDEFDKKQKRKEGKKRYIVAFFAQCIAYVVGALWMLLLSVF